MTERTAITICLVSVVIALAVVVVGHQPAYGVTSVLSMVWIAVWMSMRNSWNLLNMSPRESVDAFVAISSKKNFVARTIFKGAIIFCLASTILGFIH